MARTCPANAWSFSCCQRPISSSSSLGVAGNTKSSAADHDWSTSAASSTGDIAVSAGRDAQSAGVGGADMNELYGRALTKSGEQKTCGTRGFAVHSTAHSRPRTAPAPTRLVALEVALQLEEGPL